ncbi:MAG: acyltransferase [Nostoc sp. ChiSLP02]|nr:acyltransferase [Nostoc sp. DedSLP05]MDZ8102357.1 acyltransferase [Nostoc sp. DedSLP01]MDZ8187845.1 acyltransferase [Nostoc sp. ChiSLP02]
MSNNKDLSFQALRGIAIIAVVAIHASNRGKLFIHDDLFSLNYELTLIFREFINYAVAIFIFISGYFAPTNYFSQVSDYLIFYKKRLTRLLIPYLFWCFFIILFLKSAYNWNLFKIFINITTGRVEGPYYFIIVLTQLIVLTPFLISSIKSIAKSILWLSLTPLTVVVLYFSELYFKHEINFPWNAISFSTWMTFYYFGMLAKNYKKIIYFGETRIGTVIFLYIASLFFSIIESLYLYKVFKADDLAGSQLKISSILYSFCLILLFISLRKRIKFWPKILVILGEFSFGIYLIHILVLEVIESLINKIEIIYNFNLLCIFIATFSTIFICYTIIYITRKLIGVRISQKYLGF